MFQSLVLFLMMKQMQLLLVHNKNKGFSLIEMVITVGIIAIIIVALATMGIFTLKKASESNNKSRALRFAQESVEGIRYYRDVNKTAFGGLVVSSTSGNYVLEMGTADVGWNLKTSVDALGGSATAENKGGCQDPVLDNSFKTKTICESQGGRWAPGSNPMAPLVTNPQTGASVVPPENGGCGILDLKACIVKLFQIIFILIGLASNLVKI